MSFVRVLQKVIKRYTTHAYINFDRFNKARPIKPTVEHETARIKKRVVAQNVHGALITALVFQTVVNHLENGCITS